jgi:hypothetical protein
MPESESATIQQRQAIARRLIDSLRRSGATGGLPARAPSCEMPPVDDLPVAHGPKERFILFAPPLVRAILEGRKTMTRRLITPQPLAHPPAVCSFGVPGDLLWVREKWGFRRQFYDRHAEPGGPFVYAADGPPMGAIFLPWKPSLHMPRAACRIRLKITTVRAERVSEISKEDAAAEGCPVDRLQDPIAWFREVWNHYIAKSASSWRANPWVWVISFRTMNTHSAE